MELAIPPDTQRLIEEHVRTGRFASAEDFVAAAVAAFDRNAPGEFTPGELDALLAEGEASESLDGDAVLKEFRRAVRGKAG
ncbi:MAG TPA: hypothetical protein VEA69_20730 [Tepidisphaeraceae bacterium]|nr:hypothetical protein [Tepidisphaeraceae bacterium]